MKKVIGVLVVVFMLGIATAHAQNMSSSYTTALGIKVWGDGGGISVKHFITSNHALEGIGYFWNGGARITGLYEFHFEFVGAPGLRWYVGPGAHVGFYNNHYYDRHYPNDPYPASRSFVGIDGVIGLDYKFTGAPINLSIDWQPSFEFGDNRGFVGSWGGLGVRYTF